MSTITTNYGLIKPELSDTADITAYNSNWDKIDTQLNNLKQKAIQASSEDGLNYHATVDGITELFNGLEITIVPDMTNTSANPTLNVNTIGAKTIKLPLSTNTSATIPSPVGFFVQGRPIKLVYDSTSEIWKTIDKQKTSASDLYGTLPVASGGTGSTTAAEARENLEITPANIGALPAILVEGIHYGTEEQLPQPGTKGRIFFVKIEE